MKKKKWEKIDIKIDGMREAHKQRNNGIIHEQFFFFSIF